MTSENNKELSPSEQRALNAEKKAAWRQARLKSLEQVINFIVSSLSIELLKILNHNVIRMHYKRK